MIHKQVTPHGVEYLNEEDFHHRVNGPALEWDDGDWCWMLNGDSHRYYGPADCMGEWFIHDKFIKSD